MVFELAAGDFGYPLPLREIDDFPKELHVLCEGGLAGYIRAGKYFENCLAVVGSRKMTNYGKAVVERLVPELVSAGITVVSGFMYGVDVEAHRVCVENGGKTVGVLAYGVEKKSVGYLRDLQSKILEGGGIFLSEYGGNEPPKKWMFPRRNRIIAGLCKAVLVVEAEEGSGTIITAEFAKKYNRKVFAVPGSIFSENSVGANKLLLQGADPAFNADVILNFYGLGAVSREKDLSKLGVEEVSIIKELSAGFLSFDELVVKTALSREKLAAMLMGLQLKGFIKENGGAYHVC